MNPQPSQSAVIASPWPPTAEPIALEQLLGMTVAEGAERDALLGFYLEHRAAPDGDVHGAEEAVIYGRATWNPHWEVYEIGRTTRWTVSVRPYSGWIVTLPDPGGSIYEDCWHYAGLLEAYLAARTWLLEGGVEPHGWHSHPQSGRRRPGGDASREFNGTIDVQEWLDNLRR